MCHKDCRMERINHRQGCVNAFKFCQVWKDKICVNSKAMAAILHFCQLKKDRVWQRDLYIFSYDTGNWAFFQSLLWWDGCMCSI